MRKKKIGAPAKGAQKGESGKKKKKGVVTPTGGEASLIVARAGNKWGDAGRKKNKKGQKPPEGERC